MEATALCLQAAALVKRELDFIKVLSLTRAHSEPGGGPKCKKIYG